MACCDTLGWLGPGPWLNGSSQALPTSPFTMLPCCAVLRYAAQTEMMARMEANPEGGLTAQVWRGWVEKLWSGVGWCCGPRQQRVASLLGTRAQRGPPLLRCQPPRTLARPAGCWCAGPLPTRKGFHDPPHHAPHIYIRALTPLHTLPFNPQDMEIADTPRTLVTNPHTPL